MNISKMTNLYQVTKTLRFGLIPQGKTMDNIIAQNILSGDNKRAEEYKIAKRIIDGYHKIYIDESLSKFSFDSLTLESYADAYYSGDKEKLGDIRSKMMKSVSKHLQSGEKFKQLFGNDLFKKLLPEHLDENEDKEIIKNFETFSTYFTGFYENRKNMYSGEGKSTEIAYRIVVQNLPMFLDDIRVWERISEALPPEEIAKTDSELSGLTGMNGVDIFKVSSFNRFLSQKGIDEFNTYLGGYTNSDGSKVQGINEKVNLFNQNGGASVPKLKPLYKQILSDRESVSFIPDSFSSDSELIEDVRGFYDSIKDAVSVIAETVLDLNKYDLDRIYVPAGTGITELSAVVFDSWRTVGDGLRSVYEKEHPYPDDPAKVEKYLEKQEKEFKRIKSYSLNEIRNAGNVARSETDGEPEVDLAKAVSERVQVLKGRIEWSYGEIGGLLSSSYPEDKKLAKDDEAISGIKEFLEALKEFSRFCELLLGSGDEADKDSLFYGNIEIPFRELKQIDRLYDKVRNYLTKKPFSTEKIKLTFNRSDFLSGWAQPGEWGKQEAHLFKKDGKYYLFITSRTLRSEEYSRIESRDNYNEAVYFEYLFQKPDNKNTPRLFVRSKGEGYAPAVEKYNLPLDEIIEIYDKGLFKTEYRKKDPATYKKSLEAVIDYFKLGFSRHESYKEFTFEWKETKDYKDIAEFYKDTINSCYKISEKKINFNGLLSLVDDNCGYLFEIYSKDLSEHSHGTPNLHTIYFKMLFDGRNEGDIRLLGGAEIFYRAPSLKLDETVVHKANEPIANKNPLNEKKTSTFEFDLIKDRRYTRPHFELHFPISLNAKSDTGYPLNGFVREELASADDVHVIGIDRGERNLIYVSVIDAEGKIVEQYSLNRIVNESGGHRIETDYHDLLDRREGERLTERREWKTIENIKELKEGYISQAVYRICRLAVKYRAIVVMENLNSGFKNTRSAVEKSVYQKFEKMLCDKLSLLALKDVAPDAEGGVLHAYQLATPKANYKDMRGQNGIIFYVPAWLTSKIDPTTGFADLLKVKFESVDKSKQFFRLFDAIAFDPDEDLFEFHVDYTKFQRTEADFRKKWVICSNGERIRTFRNSEKKNTWDNETVRLTEAFKKLFGDYSIDYRNGDLKESIVSQTSKPFFVRLSALLSLTLQMRNSVTGTEIDYLISPVRNSSGVFYDSRKGYDGLPCDADANGAYNIARKGLWSVRKLQESDDPANENLAITNAEWLRFAQDD